MRSLAVIVPVSLITALVAACGGSTLPSTSGDAGVQDSGKSDSRATDASHHDAVTGDGGCIKPTVGEACTSAEVACQPQGDRCCVPQWTCEMGTWRQVGLGCACQVTDAAPSKVPTNHRTDDSQCATPTPAGNCPIQVMPMGSGACSKDTDCTAGTNGRCVEEGGGALYCGCTYDTCAGDSACATGEVCACHGSAYVGGQGNTCEPGNCRVDSDCGVNGYCSPSINPMSCGSLLGYYCHTAADECVNDTDCTGGAQGPNVCAWSSTVNHWQCKLEGLCG